MEEAVPQSDLQQRYRMLFEHSPRVVYITTRDEKKPPSVLKRTFERWEIALYARIETAGRDDLRLGVKLRAMMPWIAANKLVDKDKN